MSALIQLYRDADIKAGPVPADVLAYWRAKELRVGFDYRDVWKQEHDFAFTAAKIMRTDVLELVRESLDTAIAEGQPFEQWVKNLEPRAKELGWWDEHQVQDPETGKLVKVNPPERLLRIFDTNMRVARAVGQYDRIQRTKKSKPYLLYQVGPSARHREQHLAWHGLLLPVDDPFWTFAFPPNGWGCKCGVRAVSSREADRIEGEGILAPDAEPELDDDGLPTGHLVDRRIDVRRTAPPVPLVPWENKRTGNIELVRSGIDPGFDKTPGAGRAAALKPVE